MSSVKSSLLVLILVFGLMFALFYFSSTFSVEKPAVLVVRTDKPSYNPGDMMTISGTISSSILRDESMPVLIRISNPDGSPLRVDQVSLERGDSTSSFSYEVKMRGLLGSVQGQYQVSVNYAEHQAETTFNLR